MKNYAATERKNKRPKASHMTTKVERFIYIKSTSLYVKIINKKT